jgi:hypothetical protein
LTPTIADYDHLPPLAEIIPLSVRGSRLFLLSPDQSGSWLVPCTGGAHPEHSVARVLVDAGLHARVVHSTSWRHEKGRLVLTYVACLDEEPMTHSPLAAREVCRQSMARGTPTSAPERITFGQVVEHGLHHLAWLVGHDRAVRNSLTGAWIRALSPYVNGQAVDQVSQRDLRIITLPSSSP